jgi:hypothetical protein
MTISCGTFQNFVATVDGAKFGGMFLKAGRDELAVFFPPGFIAGFFAGEDHVSGQGILPGVGAFSQKRTIEARDRGSILGK